VDNPFPGFTGFVYRTAIPYECGVTRRDPSPVVEVAGTYYVWYSRSTEDSSGYAASVWWASSPDGLAWTERGEAVPKGSTGSWDEHGVFTPSVLVVEAGAGAPTTFHLYYTGVPDPFTNDDGGPGGTPTAIGVAVAESPLGPWRKFAGNPVLKPGPQGAFDSHRVDDACLIVREGAYWLYYKGRGLGLTPAQTKMGLAVGSTPLGPFEKSSLNPLIDSGHEVCVWPHGDGVAALVAPTGPQGNTLQYSEDGLHFDIVAPVRAPKVPGPFRADGFTEGTGPGITWGICQGAGRDRPYLLRFDCHLARQ